MFVVLAAGMLTALTATMTSVAKPVFADKLKCEDNDNNNCNTNRDHYVDQKVNCKIENENKDHSDNNANGLPQTLNCQAIGTGDGSLTVNQSPFNQSP